MLNLSNLTSQRVFPSVKSSPQINRLSILDNTASYQPKDRALFVYERVNDESASDLSQRLADSLSRLLSVQPYWAGQLQYTSFDPNGGYKHRLGCLEIKYGEDSDPGVSFSIADCSSTLDQVVPNFKDCINSDQCFPRDEIPFVDFFDTEPLAMDTADQTGKPMLTVRVIRFACGGLSVGIIIPHYLGDATTFSNLIEDFARASRGEEIPIRYLDADTVDRIAGDLEATKPETKEKINHHISNTFDFWASLKGAPAALVPFCTPSPQVAHLAEPYGKPIDWNTWDFTTSFKHCQTFFSPEEIHNMYVAATSNGQKISHLDALNAHIWMETAKANEVSEGDITFWFPLDIRRRTGLPDGQIGNLVTLRGTEKVDVNSPIGTAALAIRSTISKVTKDDIANTLLCMAFETTPTRFLPFILSGKEKTTLTSWLSSDLASTDFGWGRPRYFDTRPSSMIANYHILNTLPSENLKKPWHEKGAIVSTWLTEEEMKRFQKSTTLRKYRS